MSEILKIVGYEEMYDWYECIDEKGNKRRMDLLVNGDIDVLEDRNELVGKTVKIGYAYPYIEIGMDVEIIVDDSNGQDQDI